jgi:hypothetical protein
MACVIEYPHGVGRCFIVAACLALFVLVVAQLVRGPVDSLGSAVFPTSRPGVKYGGRVEPGYEAVAEILRLRPRPESGRPVGPTAGHHGVRPVRTPPITHMAWLFPTFHA